VAAGRGNERATRVGVIAFVLVRFTRLFRGRESFLVGINPLEKLRMRIVYHKTKEGAIFFPKIIPSWVGRVVVTGDKLF
jgi:iron-sulfur cluster repair protein YtfE (RIC family)